MQNNYKSEGLKAKLFKDRKFVIQKWIEKLGSNPKNL